MRVPCVATNARSHTKTDDTRYESAGINEYARGHRTAPQEPHRSAGQVPGLTFRSPCILETIFGTPTDRTGPFRPVQPSSLHAHIGKTWARRGVSVEWAACGVRFGFLHFLASRGGGWVRGIHNVIVRSGCFESDGDIDGALCSAARAVRVLE